MEGRGYPEYSLPQSDFGDPEYSGLFFGVKRGDTADITCNECRLVLKSVPAPDLRHTLDEMELTLDVASEQCPQCGNVNLFPGFSEMKVYTCRECGELVRLENGPDMQRIFGPQER